MSEIRNIILLGDSRDLIPKLRTPINCLVADPPYGMDFKSNKATTPHGKKFTEKVENDSDLDEALKLFDEVMSAVMPKLANQAEIYIFTAWHVLDAWMPLLRSYPGLELKQMLVWAKGYPGLGDLEGNWGCGHEIILYLKKGRRPVAYRRSGIISVDKIPAGQNVHPTEKPIQLIKQLIEMSTSPGDFVVDPFSGSGSTSVAAQQLGRNSLAFDIVEKYVTIGRERLKNQPLIVG